jgi:acid phosphatase family membrane protein YuiD
MRVMNLATLQARKPPAISIDAPLQFDDRIILQGQAQSIRHLVAAEADVLENMIVEIMHASQDSPLEEIAESAAQAADQAIKFLIRLVQGIFTHGEILLVWKTLGFPSLGSFSGLLSILDE